MKIVIDHDNCEHASAFADRCLGATIREPEGHERYCMAHVEDDGKPELTVVLIFDGQEHTLVLRDMAEREAVALEGWAAFLQHETGGTPAAG
ncbi:MAG TPA: hypothetical protein ENI95_15345 [Chloroflexi bacterium]|nr:hypothetical protein [Chloroflexota bacterium]